MIRAAGTFRRLSILQDIWKMFMKDFNNFRKKALDNMRGMLYNSNPRPGRKAPKQARKARTRRSFRKKSSSNRLGEAKTLGP